ncbi:MAG: hypothetical protein AAF467_20530 [Actinomycetota bacterium]
MKTMIPVLAALALLGAACSSDDGGGDAAPAIVIEGESSAAAADADSDITEDAEPATEESSAADDAAADATDDSSGDAATAAAGATDEELALELADCMRDNGVADFPDPTVNADGSIDLVPGGAAQAGFDLDDAQDAFEVCGDIVADASFLPGADLDTAELEDDLLAFAQCLRDLGFDVDDPDLSGGIGPGTAGGSPFGPNFDPTDPANADAISTCQTEVFGPGGTPFDQGGN